MAVNYFMCNVELHVKKCFVSHFMVQNMFSSKVTTEKTFYSWQHRDLSVGKRFFSFGTEALISKNIFDQHINRFFQYTL